jgi:hypothetical protein
MAKKFKDNRLPPFVALPWEMLNSKAYKELAPSAAKLLPYFLGKVKISYNDLGRYTEQFALSFSEAQKYGFASSTFSRAYKELIEKGFIEITEHGGLRGDSKSCNKFKLSKKWQNYKTQAEIEADSNKNKETWGSVKLVPPPGYI